MSLTRRSRLVLLLLVALPFLTGFDNEILVRLEGEVFGGESFGATVEGVGDVDGNGVDDFVIGDHSFDSPGLFNQGRAYLYMTHRNPLRFERVVLPGAAQAGLYGKEISALGDLNGDGRDDFMITSENQRRIVVYLGLGQFPWVSNLTLSAPSGVRTSDAMSLGDVNGDGFQDLLVEAIIDGEVYIASWLAAWNLTTCPRLETDVEGLGTVEFERIHTTGDLDGDGLGDFVVTASQRVDGQYRSYALLYLGSRTVRLDRLQPVAVLDLYPDTSLDFFDLDVGPDLDGDARPELFVSHRPPAVAGAPRVSALSYRGPGDWQVIRTYVAEEPGTFGYAAVVADFDRNGDGVDDVVFVDGFVAPTLRVYDGTHGGDVVETSDFLPSMRGLEPSLRMSDVANVGDLDGDGLDDLLIGAQSVGPVGMAYLVRGGASRALNFQVTRTDSPATGLVVLDVGARIEGTPDPHDAFLTEIDLTIQGPYWKVLEILDVENRIPDRSTLTWSRASNRVRVEIRPERWLAIRRTTRDLVRVTARIAGITTEQDFGLVSAASKPIYGRRLWVTADQEWIVDDASMAVDAPAAPRPAATLTAFPSPANPRTSFRVTVPAPGSVAIDVFDVRGRRVWQQSFVVAAAGPFDVTWTGIDSQGRPLASGVYTARATGSNWSATTRVVIVQ